MAAGKWNRPDNLQQMWKTAKTAAETKAKTNKEWAAAFAKLQKEKLNENLGDALGKWPSSYPDVAKLEAGMKKIQEKLNKYSTAIKSCAAIGTEVPKTMNRALADIKVKITNQFDDAKLAALGADVDVVRKMGSPGMIGAGPGNKIGAKK